MPTPQPKSYTSTGVPIQAGRDHWPNTLLDLVKAAAAGTWVKANVNNFVDAWPIEGLRPAGSSTRKIIGAWASFGWDTRNHRLILFGGGHGNTDESTVYQWSAVSRQWSVAYYAQGKFQVDDYPSFEPTGRILNSPLSAHTYDNQLYLPVLDVFYTPGGASVGNGGSWALYDLAVPYPHPKVRNIPVFLCDMALAGQGFVGGLSGTNRKELAVTYDIAGARAWKARDWGLYNPAVLTSWGSVINCAAATRVENGCDVVYQMRRPAGATSKSLRRVEFVDSNAANDIVTIVGSPRDINSSVVSSALHNGLNCFVTSQKSSTVPFVFWDLDYAAPSGNVTYPVAASALIGPGAAEFLAATNATGGPQSIEYDPLRDRLVSWGFGGKVFGISVPEGDPVPNTGWYVEVLGDVADPASRPMTYSETTAADGTASPICGKWRYASDLDVFIALNHNTNGNVWCWKPDQWVDPRS